MGLMNLLNAGQSLSSAQDRPHRFKLKRDALPNFGNVDGAVRVKKPVVSGLEWGGTVLENAPLAGNEAMKTETVEQKTVKAPMVQVPTLSRWLPKGNPFKSRRAPQPQPLATIQGELRLDNVKPVRNDLSESDLELVVAARPVSVPLPVSVNIESVDVPVVSVKPWWARVGQLVQRVRGRG